MNETEQELETLRADADEQIIVDRIYSAVMEQKLAPRTKLSEQSLCEAFGVGRMRVRRALLLLSSQGIVELHSNRGAFVACPSPDEAREVFLARLLVEIGVVRELAREISRAGVDALRSHIEKEDEARARSDRTELIRLSGEFHVVLAKCHNNKVLTRVVRELVTRSSLIVALFGTNKGSSCPDDEHVAIIDAIASGDPQSAENTTRQHLLHVKNTLNLKQSGKVEPDLVRILSGRV